MLHNVTRHCSNYWGCFLRLKKIEIIGFKSFADKTVLEFHEGITAIVGPNGCGKSNTADAFRWVLGEQSAKSLRGGKMHDVIFAGASQRKPLNMAEVTITLTGNQGELPIDYHEVAVTRRLFRSGESAYLINGNPVRLKDLQNLFASSGIGKNSMYMFEQGKLDEVIRYTPLERRFIFESAADIGPFLQKKAEALRKLQQSEGNVERVKDIHLEVQKQMHVLQEQAEKARIYKENKINLELYEKAILVMRWDSLETKLATHQQKEESQQKLWEAVTQEALLIQEQFKKAKEELDVEEKALQARKEAVYKTQSEKELKSQEIRSNAERLKELLEKEKKWKLELEAIIEKRLFHDSEAESLRKTQRKLDVEQKEQEKKRTEQVNKVSEIGAILKKKRDDCQEKQKDLLVFVQKESLLESDLKQNRLRLETNIERTNQVQEKKAKITQSIEQLTQQSQAKKKEVDDFSAAIDQQRALFNSMEKQLQEVIEELDRGQTLLQSIQKEQTESTARQKVLIRMREDLEGFSAGSKILLQEAQNAKSPLFNKLRPLYECIESHPETAKKFTAVMQFYVQTLAVQTLEDLNQAIAFIQKNKIKDISLLCLEMVNSEISDHFFKNVQVSGTTLAGLQLVQKHAGEVLTEDESFIDHRKVIFFGFQKENTPFSREAELKSLEKKLLELQHNCFEQEEQMKQLSNKKSKLQMDRMELDKIIRKDEMKLMESNFALQRYLGDLEKAKGERSQLDVDLRNLRQAYEELMGAIEDMDIKLRSAKDTVTKLRADIAILLQDVEKDSHDLQQEQNLLQTIESDYHRIADENKKAVHALNVLEVKNKEGHIQQVRLEEELHMSQIQQLQFKQKGSEYAELLKKVESDLEQVVETCSEIQHKVQSKKEGISKLESKITQINQQLKEHEKNFYQIETQIAQTKTQREGILTELQDRYQLTLEQARIQSQGIDKTLEQIEKILRSLRNEVESAGDINLSSIEEFAKYQTRHQFLHEQIEDLEVSKKELMDIIAELDSESRKIFKEVFEKIRLNFQKNFKILFVGGEADLQFTDTEDILEAGIEIIAKPPGKQMRSINLLSGGEKCLTAVALLFSIFEVKSSPFCILDEIDAPLDDSNVERFVNVVKEFVDRCQFIIITHNKRTMAIADRIYGVSMEEKGVSKLLSIEFNASSHVPQAELVSV